MAASGVPALFSYSAIAAPGMMRSRLTVAVNEPISCPVDESPTAVTIATFEVSSETEAQ